MASILDLTTTDAVRAVLGVDSDELPDAKFTILGIEDLLSLEIMGTECITDTVLDIIIAGKPPTAPASNRKKYLGLQGFALYFAAYVVGHAAEGFLMRRITDGQNAVERNKQDVDKLLLRLRREADRYLGMVCEAYDTTAASAEGLFGSAPPAYDPVTGESS